MHATRHVTMVLFILRFLAARGRFFLPGEDFFATPLEGPTSCRQAPFDAMASTETHVNTTTAVDLTVSDPLVWVGFASAVLSAIGSTVALLLIKRSEATEKDLHMCRRKRFWVGLFLNFMCEAVLTNLGTALAPMALIAPIAHFFQAASVFCLGLPSHGTVTFTSLHFTGELRCLHKRR